MRDDGDISHFGNFADVNAEAEILIDLAFIYQGSADSRPVERDLAADGGPDRIAAVFRPREFLGDPGTFERRDRRMMIPGQRRHKIFLPKSYTRQFCALGPKIRGDGVLAQDSSGSPDGSLGRAVCSGPTPFIPKKLHFSRMLDGVPRALRPLRMSVSAERAASIGARFRPGSGAPRSAQGALRQTALGARPALR
jgi:hypothetical protein